jgi:hypothetical protein
VQAKLHQIRPKGHDASRRERERGRAVRERGAAGLVVLCRVGGEGRRCLVLFWRGQALSCALWCLDQRAMERRLVASERKEGDVVDAQMRSLVSVTLDARKAMQQRAQAAQLPLAACS